MLRRLFQEHRHHLREIIVFALVGVGATLTHYGMALLINEQVYPNVYLANFTGYGMAVLVSYFGHSLLSFRVGFSRARFLKFCIASLSTFVMSQLLLWFLQIVLPERDRITLLIVVVSIPAISYVINKLWVFR
ncbi:hypothetical protein TDB9533_03412 [Thalassocella blandensis]|nr:hypothetical protein TDB9533_03412 [Thalassocella blandensis]